MNSEYTEGQDEGTLNFHVMAGRHWVIDKDGRPLVTISANWQIFLKEMAGKVVLVGRRTLGGLPEGQPLGNRANIALTRNMWYKVKGAVVCHSLEEAPKTLRSYNKSDIYIMGGKSIYRQFLPYCITVHVTNIDYTYSEDAYFPDLEKEEGWYLTEKSDEQTYFDLRYIFRRFQRKEQ